MSDFRDYHESELGKLSIEELKDVVRQIKENREENGLDQDDDYSLDQDNLQLKKPKKFLQSCCAHQSSGQQCDHPHGVDSKNLGSKKPSFKNSCKRKSMKDKYSVDSNRILKSSKLSKEHIVKVKRPNSIAQRIEHLEQELEVAKNLDSSFADLTNDEKRRQLSQLRRSLLREKYKLVTKRKKELDKYQPPIKPEVSWRDSLRSPNRIPQIKSHISPSRNSPFRAKSLPKNKKRKLNSSHSHCGKQSLPTCTANEPRSIIRRPLSAERSRFSKVRPTLTRVASAGSQKKKSTSSTLNAKIALRLQDVEEQIQFLEKRLAKRNSLDPVSKKEEIEQQHQIMKIAERLYDLEEGHLMTREILETMQEDIESIHFGQDDQKILLERLTKAVLKQRRQQQEYNDTFEKRIQRIEERASIMEKRQRKFRAALASSPSLEKGKEIKNQKVDFVKYAPEESEVNIEFNKEGALKLEKENQINEALKEDVIPTIDNKKGNTIQTEKENLESTQTRKEIRENVATKNAPQTTRADVRRNIDNVRYSAVDSSDEEVFEAEMRTPASSQEDHPELLSKYAKLKNAFHRVYGANRNFQKALLKDTESDDVSISTTH